VKVFLSCFVVFISDAEESRRSMTGEEEDKICRNCHEAGGDLIKPCSCTGDIKWVHRDCLNTWRSVSPNPKSFSHCDICGQPYYMRRKKLGAGPYVKMLFGMFRDIFLVLLVVAILIVVPGAVIYGIEAGTHFMEEITSDGDILNVVTNPCFDIFAVGAAFDCFVIGIGAIIYGIIRCLNWTCKACCCFPIGSSATTYYTYNTYHYHSTIPAWWWWYVFLSPPRAVDPCCCCCCFCDGCCRHSHCTCDCAECCCACVENCKCNGNNGGCDCDNAGTVMIIILIVIVIIIIMIGFIVGTIMLAVLTIRIINNHITILQKQKEAQELEIIDLSHGLAKDDSSIIVLNDNYDFVSPGSYAPEQQGLLAGAVPVASNGYPQPQVMTAGYVPPPNPTGYDQSAPSAPPAGYPATAPPAGYAATAPSAGYAPMPQYASGAPNTNNMGNGVSQ